MLRNSVARRALIGAATIGLLSLSGFAVNGNATDPLVISVPIGGKTTVSFEANVPEKMPTDVIILADTTGSSSGNLEVAKSQLLGLLRSPTNSGNRVGLGAVSDVSTFPFGTVNDKPFVLIQPITELREIWEDKITRLQTVEGGGDGQEGQLPALIAALAEKSGFTPDLGSRRVVLLTTDGPPHVATDQWCGDPCIAYPGPQTADVQALLDAKGVTVIVLSRGHSGVLRSMAKRTGGAVIALDTLSAIPGPDPIADAYEATLPVPVTGLVATPSAANSVAPLSAGPPVVPNSVEPLVASTVVEPTQTPGPTDDSGADALITVPSRADQRAIKLQAALASAPVIVRPVVGACPGVSMVFDPPFLRAPVGGKATFSVTVEASPELLPSSQKCAVNLGFGSETVFSVEAKPLCDGPSSSSSSSSVEPTSSTTPLVSTTSSIVDPSTTVATTTTATTTTATPTTTTEPSTTSSAPAQTTTTIASSGPTIENVATTTTSLAATTPGTALELSPGPTIVASPTQSPEDATGTSTSTVPITTTSAPTVDQAPSSIALPVETSVPPTVPPGSSINPSTTPTSAVTTTLPVPVVNPGGCLPRPPG